MKLRARDPALFTALTAVFNLDPSTGALREPGDGA